MHRTQKITLQKAFKHLHTINHHRYLVMKYCFRIGLYRQGLLHDLSKYSPEEFLVGARYFQGNRSPNNAEREDIGYSSSWLHHKGRNKHHYEYWVDYNMHAKSEEDITVSIKMPGRYVAEMFCDRIAASRTYKGDVYTDKDPLAYFRNGRTAQFVHPETAALLEKLLTMLAEEGEDAAFSYIRAHLYQKTPFGRKIRRGSL